MRKVSTHHCGRFLQIHLKTLNCVLASKDTGQNGFLWGKGSTREFLYLLFQTYFEDLLKDIQNSNNCVKVYDNISHIFK